MKLADIEVGREYAVALGDYDRRDPSRVRVVAKGVQGLVMGDAWSWLRASEQANYVEVEVVGDRQGRGLNWRYECDVHPDGGLWLAPRYQRATRPTDLREAWRVPARAFWMPWEIHAAAVATKEALDDERRVTEDAESAAVDVAMSYVNEVAGASARSKDRPHGELVVTFDWKDVVRLGEALRRLKRVEDDPRWSGLTAGERRT